MTSRIALTFERAHAQGERALIPYLTAGFPRLSDTVGLLRALERGGADIIELGVPFSDPIADGPTIQASCAESLRQGTTLAAVLEMVREFRRESQVPIVLFGAYNPFLRYGLERLARDASEAGADALLIPDLPVDEGEEAAAVIRGSGLDLVFLVAPTTPLERKRLICSKTSGFVYYISVKGVTGARESITFELEQPLAELRSVTTLPIAVGFGIATPAQAAAVGRLADGVIVGSALVKLVGEHAGSPDLPAKVEQYMRAMKEPLRGSSSPAALTQRLDKPTS